MHIGGFHIIVVIEYELENEMCEQWSLSVLPSFFLSSIKFQAHFKKYAKYFQSSHQTWEEIVTAVYGLFKNILNTYKHTSLTFIHILTKKSPSLASKKQINLEQM